jgi:LysR family transcriptional regulator, cys regulon transcriptional activator
MCLKYSESMTLQQLRFLREIARQSLNISSAASVLHTSQPGVSRQIQLLERELGVELLARRKNRVLGFTEAGRAILESAQRMLNEADNIRLIAEEIRASGGGRLSLATSHLHARYTLLAPVKAFAQRHPEVELHLLQADPDEVPRLVEAGEADIGISTEVAAGHPALVMLAGGVIRRSVIMPVHHSLGRKRRITLADLARYPIVGYSPRSRGGQIINSAFSARGIKVHFVVSASDSDVIKAYVAEGLGIAIVPTLALGAGDGQIHAVDATHLFPRSMMTISLRRGAYLRSYLTDFVRMLAPRYTREAVARAMDAEC